PAPETRHLLPASGESRQPVLELRELHLDPALPRARVKREDVEDHGRAIDDRHVRDLLERALLRRLELVVAHDDVGAQARDLSSDLAGLPLAHVRVWVTGPSLLQRASRDDAAGRLDERPELIERIVTVQTRARKVEIGRASCRERGTWRGGD